MKTLTVTIDGSEWHVIHHSDWSGMATIRMAGDKREVVLPAALLAACGFEAATSMVIAAVEQLEPPGDTFK